MDDWDPNAPLGEHCADCHDGSCPVCNGSGFMTNGRPCAICMCTGLCRCLIPPYDDPLNRAALHSWGAAQDAWDAVQTVRQKIREAISRHETASLGDHTTTISTAQPVGAEQECQP